VNEWFGWLGLLVGVVAIVCSVWAARRWGNRRGRIDWSVAVVPLLPKDVHPGLLSFTYRDFPVDNPHLVTLELVNTGPKDVPSSAFDSSRPIAISFGQTFYGITGSTGGVALHAPAIGASANDAIVNIRPLLLKRGRMWSFTVVVSGAPDLSIESSLIDTDIQLVDRNDGTEVRVRLSLFGVSTEIPVKVPRRRKR
jgi:hypothetical protein